MGLCASSSWWMVSGLCTTSNENLPVQTLWSKSFDHLTSGYTDTRYFKKGVTKDASAVLTDAICSAEILGAAVTPGSFLWLEGPWRVGLCDWALLLCEKYNNGCCCHSDDSIILQYCRAIHPMFILPDGSPRNEVILISFTSGLTLENHLFCQNAQWVQVVAFWSLDFERGGVWPEVWGNVCHHHLHYFAKLGWICQKSIQFHVDQHQENQHFT